MKKNIKRIAIIAGVIIGIAVIFFIVMFVKTNQEVNNLEYSGVEVSDVKDGVYQGSAETTLVKVEVEVTVKEHKIMDIKILKHDNGMGGKAEQITENMIDSNTYEVDAVSGATVSSEVIKSAVSKALVRGKK